MAWTHFCQLFRYVLLELGNIFLRVYVSFINLYICTYNLFQMPRGVPVATVAVNNATNAGLLAVRMLGVADVELQARYAFIQLFV